MFFTWSLCNQFDTHWENCKYSLHIRIYSFPIHQQCKGNKGKKVSNKYFSLVYQTRFYTLLVFALFCNNASFTASVIAIAVEKINNKWQALFRKPKRSDSDSDFFLWNRLTVICHKKKSNKKAAVTWKFIDWNVWLGE